MLLFVYGTLRSDSEHRLARELHERARPLGTADLAGRRLELGEYPGLVISPEATDRVAGELYEFDDPQLLAELDRYEGCDEQPPEFERRELELRREGGERLRAWVYVYVGPIPD